MRLLCCLLTSASLLAAQGISRDEYQQRRAELRKSLEGVLVLFGAEEPEDLHARFFQDTNFLYLTGWREPGAALLLTRSEEVFFLPARDEVQERYTGPKLGFDDPAAPKVTGFAKVRPMSALQAELTAALPTSRRIYTIPGDAQGEKVRSLAVFHEQGNAATLIQKLRMVKSPSEIELISRATDISMDAHRAAWAVTKPGEWEYQIAAVMTNSYLSRGCERSAYAPIVGSGPNSVVLHYAENHRQLQPNETVVMDVGAECADYATDITRTVPSSGKFTARQRELYDIVRGAQQAAIDAIKPGITLMGANSLDTIARDYISTHGKDLHGNSLGPYFLHGLGHHVGLDVHDPSDVYAPLKAGMVITIEPGIYIAEENIGIRIEDIVLVTEDGHRVLSASLPSQAAEVEKLVGK